MNTPTLNQTVFISQRETQGVPEVNRGLIQVRLIQARLKGRMDAAPGGDSLSLSALISTLSRAG